MSTHAPHPDTASGPPAFDQQSGSILERLVFKHRIVIVLIALVATVLFAAQATRLHVNADFDGMLPADHPYAQNYRRYREDLHGLGNVVHIAVQTKRGTVFDAAYLDTLRKINDEVFLIPGVDRPYLKSLWTSSTRWFGVTEEGLEGGPVIPDDYDGSARSLAQLRANVERSGEIGKLVAADYQSSVLSVPLLELEPASGRTLDYRQIAAALEKLRGRYETDDLTIHITGFAKVVGDMIEGLVPLLSFFAAALAIATAALLWYSRCWRGTLWVVGCSLIAVVWLLGLLAASGKPLDPYSALAPFLLLASGISHGAQMLNGVAQDTARGHGRLAAARSCFRRLFRAGSAAVLTDVAAYAVLGLVPIAAIRDLALNASLGVTGLLFTNLVLLPVLLSYSGVSRRAASRSVEAPTARIWRGLAACARRRGARAVLAGAIVSALVGSLVGAHLTVGDLVSGAPELRPDSRYNRDRRFISQHYDSGDLLVVMVGVPPSECTSYRTLSQADALAWRLQQLAPVRAVDSFAARSRYAAIGVNEGYLKWYELPRAQSTLNSFAGSAPPELLSRRCDMLPLYVYLTDHKAAGLDRVVATVREFAAGNDTNGIRFLLAGGNAGMAAATNETVRSVGAPLAGSIYALVAALCFIALRTWRAVLCAVLPLALISVLCQALTVALGIGVTVATLPVTVLGAGVGVDYALYLLAVVSAGMNARMSYAQAFRQALLSTGRVVVLMGLTLSVAVTTWVFSPIKFQADMGALLAFMFMGNMVSALMVVPALGYFLLRSTPALDAPCEDE